VVWVKGGIGQRNNQKQQGQELATRERGALEKLKILRAFNQKKKRAGKTTHQG